MPVVTGRSGDNSRLQQNTFINNTIILKNRSDRNDN